MPAPIIRIEKLGKTYTIRHQVQRAKHRLFREELVAAIKRPFTREAVKGETREEFWALRDVTFDVGEGEVIGVIGRNGAGKSTLLKILGNITDPTEGRVELRGRVASLLEVGTGFHPELTGRENIFLNGAILGMTRAEIRKNFDAIVAFSEVEKFLDTPVKRYSSGMYVRLAFSVAAHLEPEILIVDEVLAVGDSAFQQKCLGKMRGIAESEGRTVLFVSHNMASIRQLCQRACLLDKGRIAMIGLPDDAIARYLSEAVRARRVSLADWQDRSTNGEGRILELELQPGQSDDSVIKMGDSLSVRIHAEFREPVVDPVFGLLIHDSSGTSLIDLRSVHDNLRLGRVVGPVSVQLEVHELGLYPGQYFVSPWITDAACKRDIDFPKMCAAFDVRPLVTDTDLQLSREWGTYFVPSTWSVVGESS
jgi:lipopolysaccharide transport system ATP-binding protein